MEAATTITTDTNSPETSHNHHPPPNKAILLLLFLFLCLTPVILTTTIFSLVKPKSTLQEKTNQNPNPNPNPNPNSPLNAALNSACSATNSTALRHLLELSINHTINLVTISQSEILDFFSRRKLESPEKNALNDCLDMLDQTVYELGQAIDDLGFFLRPSFGNLKTLLSAAMTNENTCIDGFLEIDSGFNTQKSLRIYLEMKLTPIIRMISNSLAIIKHMEGINQEQEERSSIRKSRNKGFPPWMSKRERKMMGRRRRRFPIRPNLVVASDGSGDYRTIGEALKMAPNMSVHRFVIQIKAGIYKENVEISRNKVNIMLWGDGSNSTLISGNRSIVDGFSTFTSATLTVVGDRFLARDLTIENTASPEKHQAVALRVTSNSAFYRCNFTSYQDTLYAHSLRQFYRECTIQGTIDFIFGNAAAIFRNCKILARKPILGQSNMITAQSREDSNQNTGFLLENCTIQAAPDFTLVDQRRSYTYLGRPWRNYSRTIIMRSYLGNLIHPRGWSMWDQYSDVDTVEYIEHLNFGPGSDTRYRVRWGGYKKNSTDDVAKRFTVGAFLRGSDDWFQTTGFPLFHGSLK